jgi:hypothetical protein
MRWFRRSLDDFGPFEWVSESGVLRPLFPIRPEPWRLSSSHLAYNVPLDFIRLFINPHELSEVHRKDAAYVAQLVEEIDKFGLREPAAMKYDANGKLRFHDGHHRFAALEILGYFQSMPVTLQESPLIKGYGRVVGSDIVSLLQLLHDTRK